MYRLCFNTSLLVKRRFSSGGASTRLKFSTKNFLPHKLRSAKWLRHQPGVLKGFVTEQNKSWQQPDTSTANIYTSSPNTAVPHQDTHRLLTFLL